MRSDHRLFLPSLPVDGRGDRRRSARRPSDGGAARSCGNDPWRTGSGCGTDTPRAGRSGSARRRRARCARVSLELRIRHRDRREQGLRVRVPGIAEHRVAWAELDDRPQVHHRHPHGDCRTTARSWAMKRQRETQLVLEVLEEVDDLGLDRDVEGAHRLVGHDEIGLEHECARDADALALASGESVREPPSGVSGRPTRTSASGHVCGARPPT